MRKRKVVGLLDLGINKGYALSLKAYQENVDLVIKVAKKYNIPVVVNSQLVEILSLLSVDQDIPKELLPALELILSRTQL